MAASRKKSKSATRPSPKSGGVVEDRRPSTPLTIAAIALLVARFLPPTEGSVDGETLWLTQCWLGLGVWWVWDGFAAGRRLIRWDLLSAAMLLLVAGHLVSGIGVLIGGGDRRAAINMMWEWIGLGVTFGVVRSILPEPASRSRVIWAFTAIAAALGGLGVYQHYVWFPQVREQYERVRDEVDELRAGGPPATAAEALARQRRLQELTPAMQEYGIPADAINRTLWEQRLYSDEPFGTFALANTFAGLLAAFLFPAVWLLATSFHDRRRLEGATAAVASFLIFSSLILTKSRTAWAGMVAGAFVWWIVNPGGSARSRRLLGWGAAAVAATGLIVATAAVSGGLDREVVSEAPKSMEYRLQYWTGTAAVIRESPLLGPGPGNFRQHYLKHKPPESSEEIRDPHNQFLDVWCSGGLTALAGLLLLIAAATRGILRSLNNDGRDGIDGDNGGGEPRRTTVEPPAEPPGVWILGTAAGFLLALLAMWFIGDANAGRTLALLAGSMAFLLATRKLAASDAVPSMVVAAGAAALFVHLLGAGGVEMPAITQILVVFSIVLYDGNRRDNVAILETPSAAARGTPSSSSASSPLGGIVAGVSLLVLFGACASTATLPVLKSTWLIAAGDSVENPKEAERYYQEAAVADPFSPEATSRAALAAYRRWTRTRSTAVLEEAIEKQLLAIEKDPYHYAGRQTLAEWRFELSVHTSSASDRSAAIDAYSQAAAFYPHNARLLADFAGMLFAANEPQRAADVARSALRQDEINRREGHSDKFLDDNVRERLYRIERVAGGGSR